MANLRQRLSQLIGRKKKLAEGFGPIYKNGIITPETKNLGPKYEKDVRLKVMEEKTKAIKKKPKVPPTIRNIRNLV